MDTTSLPASLSFSDVKTSKLHKFLIKSAINWQLVPYDTTSAEVKILPHHREFTNRLGTISKYTYEKYGVVLSSLVIRKHEGVPAEHFFDFLKSELKMDVPDSHGDRLALWAKLVREAHKFYSAQLG